MQILFYPHTSKANKKGYAPLKLRLTYSAKDKVEISTGKNVDPNLWDVEKKRVSGKSTQADLINKYIVFTENKLMKIESDLEREEKDISSEIIINIFKGVHVERMGIMQAIDIHNKTFKDKIDKNVKGFNDTTLRKYIQLKDKMIYFLKSQKNRDDVFMSELDLNFIEDFWDFLTTTGMKTKDGIYDIPLGDATCCGIIGRLKKVTRIGLRKQNIAINPFDDFKCSFDKVDKQPLTMDQVRLIQDHKFVSQKLDRVRDRLIVGCFTGLADSDIQKASPDMIVSDITGNRWLQIKRTKTDELSMIPLWQPVLEIIEKYKNNLELKSMNKLFPQISNQRMNEYLQEVVEFVGIDRSITTHIARHSFADFYLNAGGTLEGLAKILGHSTTTSTRIYARRNMTSIAVESNQVRDNIFKRIDSIEKVKKIG